MRGKKRDGHPTRCVLCHNPSLTDMPCKLLMADPLISSAEVSVEFRRMNHGILAGEIRSGTPDSDEHDD